MGVNTHEKTSAYTPMPNTSIIYRLLFMGFLPVYQCAFYFVLLWSFLGGGDTGAGRDD
jgi:hypothetical protein